MLRFSTAADPAEDQVLGEPANRVVRSTIGPHNSIWLDREGWIERDVAPALWKQIASYWSSDDEHAILDVCCREIRRSATERVGRPTRVGSGYPLDMRRKRLSINLRRHAGSASNPQGT